MVKILNKCILSISVVYTLFLDRQRYVLYTFFIQQYIGSFHEI